MQTRKNPGSAVLLNVLQPQLRAELQGEYVRVRLQDQTCDLRPVWIGEGYPSDARRAIDQYVSGDAENAIEIIVGRQLSRGARELLDTEGIPWADAAGYANITLPGRFYLTRLEPARERLSKEDGVPWTPPTVATAEVILELRRVGARPGRFELPGVTEIAELAQISYPQAAKALRVFDDNGYTTKIGAERGPSAVRTLDDPGRLLSDWSRRAHRGPWERVQLYVPWRDPEQSLDLMNARVSGVRWVVSGALAANHLAPFLTQVPELLVYVAADELQTLRDALVTSPDVEEIDTGGRIQLRSAGQQTLRLASDEGAFLMAPRVRVYADLASKRERFAEAADHFRETEIGF